MSAASPLELLPVRPARSRGNAWWRRGASELDPRRNALNLLRLLLAATVLVNHCWTLSGHGEGPMVNGLNLGRWAVFGFFAISGYLITGSRLTKPLSVFLIHRIARIFPAFLVCLVVVAFGFAPLAFYHQHGTLAGFMTTPTTPTNYVLTNAALRIATWGVAGTPEQVPYPGAWNGSLWTLYYEFVCYMIIAVLCCLGFVRRRPVWLALAFALSAAFSYGIDSTTVYWQGNPDLPLLAPLLPFFLGGALVYAIRDRVPFTWPLALAGVAVSAVLVDRLGWGGQQLAAPLLAYALLWLGAVLPSPELVRRHDISYGVYIYAFPVQQLLATYAWYRWGFAVYVALTVVGAGALAVASWLLVERPVMRRARAITVVHLPRGSSAIGPPEASDPPDALPAVLESETARS